MDDGSVTVGAVRWQRQGREHVVAYASARLNKKMRQKITTKRELFAICAIVRQFKHYLLSGQLSVRTDHQAMTSLKQHEFTVHYRKGNMHRNADTLFRRPNSAKRDGGIAPATALEDEDFA